MKLRDIFRFTKVCVPHTLAEIEISNISRDSKSISKNGLFLASKGFKTDGKKFISQAKKSGAAAVVCDEKTENAQIPCLFAQNFENTVRTISKNFYKNPSSKLFLTGITGTKGKTTVSYILEKAFKDLNLKPSVIGTVNYRTYKKILLEAPNTTPTDPLLSETLNKFLKAGCRSCLMEISSHALTLKRTENMELDAAIFTNLQSDHLDFHKTLYSYAKAKRKIFENLSASSKKNKLAIINKDDKKSDFMAKAAKKDIKKVFYGFSKNCDYRAYELKETPSGVCFKFDSPYLKGKNIKLKLMGKHNVYNFMAAAALLMEKGFKFDEINKSLKNFRAVPGRLEKIESSKGFFVFVDYAHTEESLRSALNTLRKAGPKRIICVFGCGGDRDKSKRAPMGKTACDLSDLTIITSDNPRTENPMLIMNEIEASIKGKYFNYLKISDRRMAIKKAIAEAKRGDFILIAGKGHENYQILKNKKINFDDKKEAVKAMKKMGKL